MTEYLTNTTDLTKIASAIREKGGTSDLLVYPDGFVTAIGNIQTGVAKPKFVQSTTHSDDAWLSVCYGNGKFVAVANVNFNGDASASAYSTDGINWTLSTMPVAANWNSVCYGNGTFVAVDSPSSVSIYSYDGINWTNIGNDLKVFDPVGTNVTANLNKALGAATMAEVNAAIQSAIQNTWEASY